MARDRRPRPSLTLGEQQFLQHLEHLVGADQQLLGGHKAIRVAWKLNEAGELVFAVMVPRPKL